MSATISELFQVQTEVVKATRWNPAGVLVTLPDGFVFAHAGTDLRPKEVCIRFASATKARTEEARVMRAVLVRLLDAEAPNARYSLPKIERVTV